MKKDNKGITLIALIITIIVMLILVAVTINMAVNGGLFGYAKNASAETKAAKEAEESWANIEDGMSPEQLMAKYMYGENVAKIGNTLYTSLQAAIDAVPVSNNDELTEIIVLQNISECVTAPEGKNILLNLNNMKLSNNSDEPIITLSGLMQVENGQIVGRYGLNAPAILVNPDAEIDFSDTYVSRTSDDEVFREVVELHGTLKIDSGKIENTNSCAIWSYTDSDVVIEISGTAELYSTSDEYVALYNNTTGTCTITGGKITSTGSVAFRNEGTATISGNPEILSEASVSLWALEGANTTIEGGTITSEASVSLYTYAGSNTTIEGGTIISEGSNAVCNKGNMYVSGTTNIRGMLVHYPAFNNYGYVEISGGTIYCAYSYGFRNFKSGTAIITGGTFEAPKSTGIYNNDGGTISVSGATIIAKTPTHGVE